MGLWFDEQQWAFVAKRAEQWKNVPHQNTGAFQHPCMQKAIERLNRREPRTIDSRITDETTTLATTLTYE